MISASLISSGILSLIQMSKVHLFKGYYLGCGILCVVGTSFGERSVGQQLFGLLSHTYSNIACGFRHLRCSVRRWDVFIYDTSGRYQDEGALPRGVRLPHRDHGSMLFNHDHPIVCSPQKAAKDLSSLGYGRNSTSDCEGSMLPPCSPLISASVLKFLGRKLDWRFGDP